MVFDEGDDGDRAPGLDDVEICAEIASPAARTGVVIDLAGTEGDANDAATRWRLNLCDF